MAKYTFYTVKDSIFADVLPVATDTVDIPEHTLITIDSATKAVTVKATAPAVGDFLVWRPYPNYPYPGDRRGKIAHTPIPTSVGEVYGFILREGFELVVEDPGATGLAVGDIVQL